VVLDRRETRIRAGLEQAALLLALGAGVLAAAATTLLGLTDAGTGVLFAFAIAAFCLEEVVRRALMAELRFWRVAAIDCVGLLVALAVLGTAAITVGLSLAVFVAALAMGQTVAMLAGMAVLPAADRFLVPLSGGALRTVATYGLWRALQQFLRPALLTAVRTAVGIVAGLGATGLLEAGRVYVAPALLLVSGLSSYLFASFARQRDRPLAERLRRSDQAVFALLGVTAAIGIVAVLLLPVAGPLLFSARPQPIAVLGWLAYTASVAAVTPYGALAAVSGGQALVFVVRVADTVLSLAAVVVGLAIGLDPAWAAALLAIGSLAGGLVLRFALVPRLERARELVLEPA
jgi:O-antigen/teichoic acid export membrane protein